jgi:gluconate 2-dehydrogenase gamma chain
MEKVTRRLFVTSVGAATVVPTAALLSPTVHAAPLQAAAKHTQPNESARTNYLFFDSEEALFIEAACERLIPADESGPGAVGTGVPNYLDKQLGGAWAQGSACIEAAPGNQGPRVRDINCLSRRQNCFTPRCVPLPADLYSKRKQPICTSKATSPPIQ